MIDVRFPLPHLARRFFGSLSGSEPPAGDEAWARRQLLAAEADLWERMSNPDRRHAIGVARRVERALGHEAARPVLAAALLHDVGKISSALGTYGRVVATVTGAAAGYKRARRWSSGHGFPRRIGLYLDHPGIGGDLLAQAGSDALTSEWARQHHQPPERWTLDPVVAAALKAADDD
ncbi:MAG: hypothetical protein ACT4PW_00750 [Acidimicrobiia bacterium]